ncbi:MAG TPA: hypothetical protein PLZ92_04090 [Phycicoccus sp.]|nr:hypothetical protein [Phycicoccus sp.]
MARQGMDVEVVEAVAKTMHEKAQSTTSIVESAGRLIRGSEKLWLGQRADRWLADWLVEEAAVRRAAGFLEEMSKRLTTQASDQRRASGPSVGARDMSAINPTAPSDSWSQGMANLKTLNEYLDQHGLAVATSVVSVLGIKKGTWHSKPYGKLYKTITRPGGFFNYNRSLYGGYSKDWGKVLRSPGMKVFDRLTKGLGVATIGANIYDTFVNPSQREITDFEKFETLRDSSATALKMGNPAAYLLGANVTAWTMVAEEAAKLDLSAESNAMTWKYIQENPMELVASFGDACKDMATNKIWKIFG